MRVCENAENTENPILKLLAYTNITVFNQVAGVHVENNTTYVTIQLV
ncbi:MAG: hypothetical protein CM15mP36_11010 [Flavobacteriales bacterium]|nr:MAG: hypothetical protein CM15mP36_11010 [Flavobacteriales bacterium]